MAVRADVNLRTSALKWHKSLWYQRLTSDVHELLKEPRTRQETAHDGRSICVASSERSSEGTSGRLRCSWG